jgi:hypothetical protein
MRLQFSVIELIPRFTYYEDLPRSRFDESLSDQFLGCARCDRINIWFPASMELRATWQHGPRCFLRLGYEVHLQLNHISQGVLTSGTHHLLWCAHVLSSLNLKAAKSESAETKDE